MNNSSKSGGIGFCGLLAIVFIVLKLTHYIDWSWWWVLSPLFIPFAIVLIIALFVVILKMFYYSRVKRKVNKSGFAAIIEELQANQEYHGRK